MYNVYQHWDPLKICIVGRSYPAKFYKFIQNSKVRTVMEKIADETEEDYQKLIKLLNSFGVETFRIGIDDSIESYKDKNKYLAPPMCPRDYMSMVGNTFYFEQSHFKHEYQHIVDWIKLQGNNIVYNTGVNGAATTRIGKDLYFGTTLGTTITDVPNDLMKYSKLFPNNRCHVIDTQGHSDSTFCPVKPGLIISLHDVPTYKDTFPDWEVVYLPGQSWEAIPEFQKLKNKNRGKWWVPGEELNDDFTNFVESWLTHWVGYVEETVFDVNMLVVDEKNVICNNYNKQVFEAFERHGITPHVLNFRHRYFWDGGLHCITSDIHREGVQKDYFPERS